MNARQAAPDREEMLARTEAAKNKLGKDLVILAHFYQQDDIVRFADFIGDSLQLAQAASKKQDAKYIVFSAVSFMAEMARILCLPEQRVFHPEPAALCPLAQMAGLDEVQASWSVLQETGRKIIPVVYVNSRADLKAFCGRNQGLVCTSSNARKAMEYVLSQDAVPFFFPDENLGRNTAHLMGLADDEMFLWDPLDDASDRNTQKLRSTKVILWRGFCYVHTAFKPADVDAVRTLYGKEINVVVHPECTPEVVRLSNFVGSTAFIKSTVEKAPSGSKWAVGTEINFVNRIKRENPDKTVVPLKEWGCREMAKLTGLRLLHVLESLVEGRPVQEVTVEAEVAQYARVALERMLKLT
ncbi:MAG TPA: quinolinate synthase NadA [Syntrophorhabdaceae bacterium]|nr:quinolinate synthase NadA [Syntrophorhabdaceae bacterium]